MMRASGRASVLSAALKLGRAWMAPETLSIAQVVRVGVDGMNRQYRVDSVLSALFSACIRPQTAASDLTPCGGFYWMRLFEACESDSPCTKHPQVY